MREAISSGVEGDATHARRMLEQAEKLRQEKQQEKEERAKKGQLSFKEKEKRKRDAGMQASCAPFRVLVDTLLAWTAPRHAVFAAAGLHTALARAQCC